MRDDLSSQPAKLLLGFPEFRRETGCQTPFVLAQDPRGISARAETRQGLLTLPQNKKITISVISGASSGSMIEISNPRISIGRAGGGADIQLNDPEVSNLHCALGVTADEIRLCDLDSQSGTYVDGKRVDSAELEHMSEIRIGSSSLLLIVVPKPTNTVK